MALPYHTHSFEIPAATKAEVEAGVCDDVAATPASLGSSATKDVSYFATSGQGGKADNAVQNVNGKSGNSITLDKSDIGLGAVDNTPDISKPISLAMQNALDLKASTSSLAAVALSGLYSDLVGRPALGAMAAKNNVAISDISASGTASISTFLRGDGSWQIVAGSGTVTSVALAVPLGLSVANSPVTTSGTITITYASGYQGYTTAEATKLLGIAVGAQVNVPQVQADWNAVSGLASIANKPTLGTAASQNSTAFATAAQGTKADTALQSSNTAYNSDRLGNETATQWQAKIDAKVSVYTGADAAATVLPVGHLIFCWNAGTISVNALAIPRINPGEPQVYGVSGSGAALSGVWRSRGRFNTSNPLFLLQRSE